MTNTGTQGRAVRVWLGYGLDRLLQPREQFYEALGSIFIPATVQLMAPSGLQAYVPAVLPSISNPSIPDEIALVFYPDPQTYHAACDDSCAGRAYSRLHSTLFSFEAQGSRPASHSSFPVLLDASTDQIGALQVHDPGGEWQSGVVVSDVVMRGQASGESFVEQCNRSLAEWGAQPPEGLLGLYAYLDSEFMVCWARWEEPTRLPGLNLLGEPVFHAIAESLTVPESPFVEYSGVVVSGGSSFNLQFAVNGMEKH